MKRLDRELKVIAIIGLSIMIWFVAISEVLEYFKGKLK